MSHKLLLRLVDAEYAITRLSIGSKLPDWLPGPGFWTVSSSREEMTLVCRAVRVPSSIQTSGGWRCFRIEHHMKVSQPGVLESVLSPLAEAGIGIFANSTFSTDYVFIAGGDLDKAVEALAAYGHEIGR